MIRLAISCDICGAEKKQTNHWFVAYEQAGELRISGWQSRFRKKAGARHLCGQTCLHKLCDEFMANLVAGDRAAAGPAGVETGAPGPEPEPGPQGPRSYERPRVAARPMDERVDRLPDHRLPDPRWIENRAAIPPAAAAYEDEYGSSARLIPVPEPAPVEEARRYASPEWRASAWERERQRERAAG